MKRRLAIAACLLVGGCVSSAIPDRLVLGVQFDADTLDAKTYVVQGQWNIEHAK